MEIERKYIINELPADIDKYPCRNIEQAYLNFNPVIRIRKEDDHYYLTYKGNGMLTREESNLSLNEETYYHLLDKADGYTISKKRYLIPLVNPGFKDGFPTPPSGYTLTIELDVFDAPFAPMMVAEVEFGSTEAAIAFVPPEWFGEEVTYKSEYHNSNMAATQIPGVTMHHPIKA